MPSRGKTIAKNTSILYIRMIIVTLISLYTSRVILKVLGEDDYGIFNIAGSLIAFFSLVNTALAGSVQRYVNFEYTTDQTPSFKKVFNIGVELHLILGIIILFLGETLGLYLFDYLNIPKNRHIAGLYVYQFSLLSTIVTLIAIPYQALIIATEKMNFFAYNSLIETVLKLGIVYLLINAHGDKLMVYAILYFVVTVCSNASFFFYALKKIGLPKFQYVPINDKLSKEMCTFSLWNLVGNASTVFFLQGVNILLNIFWGVVVNAAMGITNQVTNTVSKFITSFQIAYKPAIVKGYAQNDWQFLNEIILKTTKLSFFLLFWISVPLILNIDFITELWLSNVPKYTNAFIQILLISLILNSISLPFWNTIEANGKIKNHQIFVACVQLGALPIGYILLKFGFHPVWVVSLNILTTVIILCQRFHVVAKILNVRAMVLIKKLILPIVYVILSILLIYVFLPISNSWLSLSIYFVLTGLSIMILGLDRDEKRYIRSLLYNL